MEVIGKIVQCNETKTGERANGTTWQTASVMIRYGEYDDRLLELQCRNNVEDFNRLPMHTPIRFYFDLQTREYNGRFYTNAYALRWEILNP